MKRDLYARFGVAEYWIVDPANRTIEVFVLQAGEYQPYSFAAEVGRVKSHLLTALEVDLAEVMV